MSSAVFWKSLPWRHFFNAVSQVNCSTWQFCWDLIRTCGFATCCLMDGTSNLWTKGWRLLLPILLFNSFPFLITVQVFTIPFPFVKVCSLTSLECTAALSVDCGCAVWLICCVCWVEWMLWLILTVPRRVMIGCAVRTWLQRLRTMIWMLPLSSRWKTDAGSVVQLLVFSISFAHAHTTV